MEHSAIYSGIDYGLGQANINHKTGIHYGVISQNSINLDCANDFEPFYGNPHCPKCGDDAVSADSTKLHSHDSQDWENYSEHGCDDYACVNCKHFLDSAECFPDESQGFTYEREGYSLTDCLDTDIFVLASPFYTFAQFCSPCVPGAGNLDSPCEDGPKTYCLGHDWFEDGKAPYKVFKVADGSEVTAEEC